MPNPLAISMSLGGLLLDVIAPRPKPRYGYVPAVSRTPGSETRVEQYAAHAVVSG